MFTAITTRFRVLQLTLRTSFAFFSPYTALQEEACGLRADSSCTSPPRCPDNGVPIERGKRGLRFETSLPPLDHSSDVLSLSAALRRQRVNLLMAAASQRHSARPEANLRQHSYHRPSQGKITTCTTHARPVMNRVHLNRCSINLFQWILVMLPALSIAKGHNHSPRVKLW